MAVNPDRNLYEESARKTKVYRALMWIAAHPEMHDVPRLTQLAHNLPDSPMLRSGIEKGAHLKSPMGPETVKLLCSELQVFAKMIEANQAFAELDDTLE